MKTSFSFSLSLPIFRLIRIYLIGASHHSYIIQLQYFCRWSFFRHWRDISQSFMTEYVQLSLFFCFIFTQDHNELQRDEEKKTANVDVEALKRSIKKKKKHRGSFASLPSGKDYLCRARACTTKLIANPHLSYDAVSLRSRKATIHFPLLCFLCFVFGVRFWACLLLISLSLCV